MAAQRKPKYSTEARTEASRIKKQFDEALSNIAESLAQYENLETVQASHLQRARKALMNPAIQQGPVWKRREFLVGAGCLTAGLAVSVGGISFGAICPGARIPEGSMGYFWVWVVVIPLSLFVVGIALAIYGWFVSPTGL